jgi:hypothetical protein
MSLPEMVAMLKKDKKEDLVLYVASKASKDCYQEGLVAAGWPKHHLSVVLVDMDGRPLREPDPPRAGELMPDIRVPYSYPDDHWVAHGRSQRGWSSDQPIVTEEDPR